MPRPRKCRRVDRLPTASFYKPQGVPLSQLKGVTISVEGLEALRLVDAEGMAQETAAAAMAVSRPTLSRILAEARTTVAKALANGWAIRIDGGDFEVAPTPGRTRSGHHHQGRGRRGGGRGHGPGSTDPNTP